MVKTVQSCLSIFICSLVLVAGVCVQGVSAQSAGDVAFTGFNGEGSASKDGFSVVLLKSYHAGRTIHFSSKEWNGSSFVGPGGDFTWTAPSGGTTSGSVLVFTDVEGSPSVNVGSISDDANMNLSGNGDIIYAYTGTDKDNPVAPFLGAIATDANLYNQPDGTEGTLDGTGLTQTGDETVLLPDNIDNAEYIGDRNGNSPRGYRNLLQNIGTVGSTTDNWNILNGSTEAPFPPFNAQSFVVVTSPILRFTADTASVGESSGTYSLKVELADANDSPVDVDVVLNSTASSVDASDLSFTSQTVHFDGTDAIGTTKTVAINISDDSNFESDEKAVFELKNNTVGNIVNPQNLTLTIRDNDSPEVVINEFLTAPPNDMTGDANGDGTRNSSDDEFAEVLNNSSSDIDISGWKLSDDGGANTRHIFPDGTVLSAGQAIVVFGGGNPSGSFGGALVQTSSKGGLSFTNGSGNVTLLDDAGTVIQDISYGSNAGDDQSLTRDPDITGSFVKHSNATGSGGTTFSPGKKVDGTSFGSKYAIGIRGNAGWRMISSPAKNTAFGDLFGDFWMQGITGSNDASGDSTIYGWSENGGGSFLAPTGMSETIQPGKGYIVYFFKDDDNNLPGIQGGFPKVIRTNNDENNSPVSVSVSASDKNSSGSIDEKEGWNLLGNPYGTDISVKAVKDALEAVGNSSLNANIYIWDANGESGNGEFVTLNDGDTIAPFQAFFVRYTTVGISGAASFSRNNLAANKGTKFYKQSANEKPDFKFNLQLHGKKYYDTYYVTFGDRGTTSLDPCDAYKLLSLNSNAISLFSTAENNRLQKNVLPRQLTSAINIPLSFDGKRRTKLTFRWNNIESIPGNWDVTLYDKRLNRTINLRNRKKYEFNVAFDQRMKKAGFSRKDTLLNKGKSVNKGHRFVLKIDPNNQFSTDKDALPESIALKPNYPNPFNPATTIPFELSKDTEVRLTVWNMIGQKVATLVDGKMEAGPHNNIRWDASNMPSGIYIARLEANGKVYIRKMTLIK